MQRLYHLLRYSLLNLFDMAVALWDNWMLHVDIDRLGLSNDGLGRYGHLDRSNVHLAS